MFYPVDSLRRGGRFYLCWVADSWPLRFATITHRQLWSQDIRNICDDLLDVMTNESGRPVCRFSLRLSSQLMRGLVRLYQRKVTVFLADLCMINANVTKHVNKKWNISEVIIDEPKHLMPQLATAALVVQEEPELENEQRIEEIIKNSSNIVGNIEEITLKESAVPEVTIPPNDGFGEENPEQALQLMKDQTIEMMLVHDKSVHHSGMEGALDVTHNKSSDKSHDKSRLAIHEAQMEPIAELDATIFRKSVADDRLTMAGLEKDVLEIPEIQIPAPDMPLPPPEQQMIEEPAVENIPVQEQTRAVDEQAAKEQPAEIQLEELEEEPQMKRRRLKNRLIIDKKIKLTADYLVTRIENPHVELRCENSSDDIIDLSVPVDLLLRRPCHAGYRLNSSIGLPLTRMYRRRLGVIAKHPKSDREIEEMAAERTSKVHTRSMLERIVEEPAVHPERIGAETGQHIEEIEPSKDGAAFNVVEQQNVTNTMEVDISELPTQKILLTEPQSQKRTSEQEISPKRQRPSGYVSFRENQQLALETSVPINEAEKENRPREANVRTPTLRRSNVRAQRPVVQNSQRSIQGKDANVLPPDAAEKSLNVMLEEAGLADIPIRPAEQEMPQATVSQRVTRRTGDSDSSETPLGSLDRTKVSLGDSDTTTDSKKFIRDQWGTEGTMVKILRSIKAGMKPLTVKRLINKGPVIAGYKSIMAARCFTSILKLKQHEFIIIKKDPETLEIKDIMLGPKFDSVK